jgi:hypothetical protein
MPHALPSIQSALFPYNERIYVFRMIHIVHVQDSTVNTYTTRVPWDRNLDLNIVLRHFRLEQDKDYSMRRTLTMFNVFFQGENGHVAHPVANVPNPQVKITNKIIYNLGWRPYWNLPTTTNSSFYRSSAKRHNTTQHNTDNTTCRHHTSIRSVSSKQYGRGRSLKRDAIVLCPRCSTDIGMSHGFATLLQHPNRTRQVDNMRIFCPSVQHTNLVTITLQYTYFPWALNTTPCIVT